MPNKQFEYYSHFMIQNKILFAQWWWITDKKPRAAKLIDWQTIQSCHFAWLTFIQVFSIHKKVVCWFFSLTQFWDFVESWLNGILCEEYTSFFCSLSLESQWYWVEWRYIHCTLGIHKATMFMVILYLPLKQRTSLLTWLSCN